MNTFEQLLSDLSEKLNTIQNNFDIYQNIYFKKRTPEFFCLELNGEAGELANLEKKRWKGRDIPPDKFAEEAADVFIALINYCNSRKINLASALINKLNQIEKTRLEREKEGLDY